MGLHLAGLEQGSSLPCLLHLNPSHERSGMFPWIPLRFLPFRDGMVVDSRASVCVYVCVHTCEVLAGQAEADCVQAGGQ